MSLYEGVAKSPEWHAIGTFTTPSGYLLYSYSPLL